jgi:hypothetical protein
MQPDVVLEGIENAGEPTRLIVLDAKYRINEDLSDSLASIHMYRDALVEAELEGGIKGIVSAAYVLSPHIPFIENDWQKTDLPGRLFHPQYRRGFRFGAITLRPGMSMTQVSDALGTVLADAGA